MLLLLSNGNNTKTGTYAVAFACGWRPRSRASDASASASSRTTFAHHLPWSFVVHDQLWNLIPVPPSVNSAKSNRLPAADYLEPFTRLQHQALQIASAALPPKETVKVFDVATFGGE
ncbi:MULTISPECIES: HNH endonuclease domain-containing protein [Thiorhodovibrio]|uniref:HNH endonuclease domain-containing protein n=1 Tax=Thiorhodovibrio TaxID=61593 RepID=UPI0019117608|nr:MULTISPECIES: HNH endonuclease domain-containing protein [Thiorhodovibrio]MBK5968358.1 hypothetical protein [Thiorhodovibrio winogradskyi]WPL13193.1 hypothetical protein Thiosp_02987 [Thiorhodovibrio litoralis]